MNSKGFDGEHHHDKKQVIYEFKESCWLYSVKFA